MSCKQGGGGLPKTHLATLRATYPGVAVSFLFMGVFLALAYRAATFSARKREYRSLLTLLTEEKGFQVSDMGSTAQSRVPTFQWTTLLVLSDLRTGPIPKIVPGAEPRSPTVVVIYVEESRAWVRLQIINAMAVRTHDPAGYHPSCWLSCQDECMSDQPCAPWMLTLPPLNPGRQLLCSFRAFVSPPWR